MFFYNNFYDQFLFISKHKYEYLGIFYYFFTFLFNDQFTNWPISYDQFAVPLGIDNRHGTEPLNSNLVMPIK